MIFSLFLFGLTERTEGDSGASAKSFLSFLGSSTLEKTCTSTSFPPHAAVLCCPSPLQVKLRKELLAIHVTFYYS